MKPGILLFASCILLYSGNISAQEKYSAVLKKDTLQFSDDTLVLGAGITEDRFTGRNQPISIYGKILMELNQIV